LDRFSKFKRFLVHLAMAELLGAASNSKSQSDGLRQ
jgi:hypothetical protein